MAETKVKVKFYMGEEQDLVDYKGARGAEALVGNPARKSDEQDLEAGFLKFSSHNNNVMQDLEAQTTYIDDNETICNANVNTFAKLFRVLCDLF